jgi:glutamyl-tRNA synthetase
MDSDKPRVRFAPAPTGYLHLGSARTALFNWLYARHHGGTFILRIEDTDLERSREDVIEQVLASMRWLGLDWDEGPEAGGPCGPYFQSQRKESHLEHARRLMESGRAYECYMSTEELDARRREAEAAKRPFRYEGWHRELSEAEKAAHRAEGRKPVLRLRVDAPAEGFVVKDLIKGETRFPAEQIDDFIIVRSDGSPAFHLANVVDDATMRITHVIRGEDHLTNTARHQALYEALGYAIPAFAHLPMILGPDRSKLSKRHGAVSVMDYREQGYLPEAVVNVLALLGWSSADGQERFTREELVARFDLDRCGRSASIFDFDKTKHFNGLLIRELPVERLQELLDPYFVQMPAMGMERKRALVELLQKDLNLLTDFPEAARPLVEEPTYGEALFDEPAMADAKAAVDAAAEAIGRLEEPLTVEGVKGALKEAGKRTGLKRKALFFPLRAALTGQFHGPALDATVALVGKAASLARLGRFGAEVDRRAAG